MVNDMFTNPPYSERSKRGRTVSDRELLQEATNIFKTNYPSLNAEAVIAFLVIADHDQPTIGQISVAMNLSDMQVFQYMAPLRTAGLVSLQAESSGSNTILLTERGEEAKQAIADIFSG